VLRFESDIAGPEIAEIKSLIFANFDVLWPHRKYIDLWELAGDGDLVGEDIVTPIMCEFNKVTIEVGIRKRPGPKELRLILLEGKETITFSKTEQELIAQKHDIGEDKSKLGTCHVCNLKNVAGNQHCSNESNSHLWLKMAVQERQYEAMKETRVQGYVERMMDPPGLFVSEWIRSPVTH
jgi:hypothetical protein